MRPVSGHVCHLTHENDHAGVCVCAACFPPPTQAQCVHCCVIITSKIWITTVICIHTLEQIYTHGSDPGSGLIMPRRLDLWGWLNYSQPDPPSRPPVLLSWSKDGSLILCSGIYTNFIIFHHRFSDTLFTLPVRLVLTLLIPVAS